VLVVIGANREKTQRESSKRSKLENENEHEDETDRGNNSGAQTSEMLPCWDADLVENPVDQSGNKIIHRGGLPVPGVFAQGPRSASAFPRPLIVLVLVLVLVIVS
jgi:hypothetical protein